MDFNINQLERSLIVLLNNNIRSIKQLQELSDDELALLHGVGPKKLEEIKALIKVNEKINVFKYFGPKSLKPKSMVSFFKKHDIFHGNILQTKLTDIARKEKLTKGKVRAFIEYKSEVLRFEFNDTLDSAFEQSTEEITNKLMEDILEPIKKYLSENKMLVINEELYQYLSSVNFKRVNLDKYKSKILDYLDYDYILIKNQNEFEKEILYQIIHKERKEISLFKLKRTLEQITGFDMNRLSDLIQILLKEGFIIFTSHGLKYNFPSIVDYINNKTEQFPYTIRRLQGKTLEEIGIEENVTRERIRQRFNKEVKGLPINRMYEKRYSYFYKNYELTQEEFYQVFQINDKQYNFLKLFFTTRLQKNLRTKEELFDNNILDKKEQERLLRIINKDYLIIDNHRIKKRKINIITYAVKLFAQKSIYIKEFQKKLIDFCKKHSLDKDFDFTDLRAVESIVLRVNESLWKYGKSFRYYGVDLKEVKVAIKQVKFNRYLNKELSTKRILSDYFDLFNSIDVYDEYELHSLFKKNTDLLPNKVKLRRMPLLEVGKGSRKNQLKDLLIEKSPIDKNEFAEIYSEKYGVNLETIKSNYLPMLKRYERGIILDADMPSINDEVLKNIKSILSDDFYFKEDVYEVYAEKFGDETLSDYMLTRIGYKPYSQFILKENYRRADLYFEEKYFSQPMFTIDDNRLRYLGSFRNGLELLRESLEIFEYTKDKFINIKKIEEKTNITKQDIKQLIDRILSQVGDKYFTIPMIEPLIEQSPVSTLGFEHTFYESILRGNKKLRFQYMGGRTVFKKTKDKFFIYDLIDEIVSRLKFIGVEELIDELNENYFINLSRDSIIQTTEMTNLYYHPVLEMMFQDIEQYYDFMEVDY